MFCKYCGTQLKDNQSFCTKCGKKQPKLKLNIQEPSPVPAPKPASQPARNISKGSTAVKAVAAVVAAAFAVFGGIKLYQVYESQQQAVLNAQLERDEAKKAAEQAQNDFKSVLAERDAALADAAQAQKNAHDSQSERDKAKAEAELAQKNAAQAQKTAEQAQAAAAQAQEAAAQAQEALRKKAAESVSGSAESHLDNAYYVNYTARVISPDGMGVNLRIGPDSSFAKARTDPIPLGTVVTISAETVSVKGSLWGYTAYDGVTGWVYLEELEPI